MSSTLDNVELEHKSGCMHQMIERVLALSPASLTFQTIYLHTSRKRDALLRNAAG